MRGSQRLVGVQLGGAQEDPSGTGILRKCALPAGPVCVTSESEGKSWLS